jgi:plastocyanin
MSDQMTFIPNRLTIRVGTTVRWRNNSDFVHTATADPGKVHNLALVELPAAAAVWDSGNLSRGRTWEHRFDIAGTYRYVCVPHELGGMVGTIIVEG